jgi:hypothetical protein
LLLFFAVGQPGAERHDYKNVPERAQVYHKM